MVAIRRPQFRQVPVAFKNECKRISNQEAVALCRKVKSGDEKALASLLKHLKPLVLSLVKKYRGFGSDEVDLIQAGNIALWKAARDFDECRGVQFTTWAYSKILGQMRKEVLRGGKDGLCVTMVDLRRSVLSAEKNFLQIKGITPTSAEIAKKLGADVDYVRRLRHWSFSLDQPLGSESGGTTFLDMSEDAYTGRLEETVASLLTLQRILPKTALSRREGVIISGRFSLDPEKPGRSPSEEQRDEFVGELARVSNSRVWQIKERALNKLAIAI